MRGYTSDDVTRLIAALRQSRSVRDAMAATGYVGSQSNINDLFSRRGLGKPTDYLAPRAAFSGAPPVELDDDATDPLRVADRVFVDREPERVRHRPVPTVEQVTLILPDAHIDYHDQGALELALAVAEEVRPTRVVILGDWIDCAPLSKHERTAKIHTISAEIEGGRYWLSALESLPSVREKIFCEGNHEFRMTRYMQNIAQGLDGLAGLSIPEALQLRENGWRFVPYNEHAVVGGVAYTHEVGYCGALSARQSGLSVSTPIVIGHNHVVTGFEMNSIDREARQSWSFGWMGRHEDVKYKHRARALREWAHCLGVGYGDDLSTWLQPCVMRNGRTYVNGKRVTV